MESDADDIADIVSETVALLFIDDSVDVIICDGSTDVEDVDVSGELNFAEDDCISIVPIDSILFWGVGVCWYICAVVAGVVVKVVKGVNAADSVSVEVSWLTAISVSESVYSFKSRLPVLDSKLSGSVTNENGIVFVEGEVEIVTKWSVLESSNVLTLNADGFTGVLNESFNVFVESGNFTLLVKSMSGMTDIDDDESVDDCRDEVGVVIISVDVVDEDDDVEAVTGAVTDVVADAVTDDITDAVTASVSVKVFKSGSVWNAAKVTNSLRREVSFAVLKVDKVVIKVNVESVIIFNGYEIISNKLMVFWYDLVLYSFSVVASVVPSVVGQE